MTIRLNKLLAQRGVGARRKCDALIQSGAVRVNGRVVTEPGTQVEPGRDRVMVSGKPLAQAARTRYFAFNKPVGVISTMSDPEGRRTLREFMPPGPRLFPVGRLDADTSGLLILTSDGALAHHLMHPRYGVEKVYRARLDRVPAPGQIARLRDGVEFEPGFRSAPARVRARTFDDGGGGIEIALHEGRYRQVRRMCEAVGLHVLKLHRVAYGPLRLGPLERGMWRELSEHEVKLLRAASARPQPRPPGLRTGGRGRPPGRERPVRPRTETGATPRRGRPARPVGRERTARPRTETGATPRRGRPARPVGRERTARPRTETGATPRRGRAVRGGAAPARAPRRGRSVRGGVVAGRDSRRERPARSAVTRGRPARRERTARTGLATGGGRQRRAVPERRDTARGARRGVRGAARPAGSSGSRARGRAPRGSVTRPQRRRANPRRGS